MQKIGDHPRGMKVLLFECRTIVNKAAPSLWRDLQAAPYRLTQSSQYPRVFVNDVLGFSAGPDVDCGLLFVGLEIIETLHIKVSTLDFIRKQMSYGQS